MKITVEITDKDLARWKAEDEAWNEFEEVAQDILDNDPVVKAQIEDLRKKFNRTLKKHHGNKAHRHRRSGRR